MARLWEVVGWKRLLVTGACLIAWRGLEQIPVSGLNQDVLFRRLQAMDTSSVIHAIGSGVVLSPYSIEAIGITPFVQAILFLPVIVGNYNAQSNPGFIRWITAYVTIYGSNPWADAVNVVLESIFTLGFTTFICGTFLALTVVVLPVLEWNASHAVGRSFLLSGYDAVLMVVMILAVAGVLERSAKVRTPLRPQFSYLP